MDIVAATAAANTTVTSLETGLRKLVTTTLAESPSLGSRLRNLLCQLAGIPQGQAIDELTEFALGDLQSDAEPILRRVRAWVSDLQQRSQQGDRTDPLVGSDSTPNTPNTSNNLASLLFCPDGSPKSPVDAKCFVRVLHSQISVFMRAGTIELPPADLDLFIQILPFALPEALASPAHSLALGTNDAPGLTPNRV
ncbi:uncharacterized protein UTRI_10144 [Ustilago trichophora]|uniref:Uncharacterized protein n=1 Tax=Ustilago trichophora TaxID=86804 RepID=A0A5C3E3T9_9BASI|nr:uncharacterized protein UTRI_10144 [Ustilago trichophora]